jgi:hypothetical protein
MPAPTTQLGAAMITKKKLQNQEALSRKVPPGMKVDVRGKKLVSVKSTTARNLMGADRNASPKKTRSKG